MPERQCVKIQFSCMWAALPSQATPPHFPAQSLDDSLVHFWSRYNIVFMQNWARMDFSIAQGRVGGITEGFWLKNTLKLIPFPHLAMGRDILHYPRLLQQLHLLLLLAPGLETRSFSPHRRPLKASCSHKYPMPSKSPRAG